jgi:hypothetical protein
MQKVWSDGEGGGAWTVKNDCQARGGGEGADMNENQHLKATSTSRIFWGSIHFYIPNRTQIREQTLTKNNLIKGFYKILYFGTKPPTLKLELFLQITKGQMFSDVERCGL